MNEPVVMLTVVRYDKWLSWAGIFSMAFFRIPLLLNRHIRFYKLMGSGKNGTFDIVPDLQQWALLVVMNNNVANVDVQAIHGSFIRKWWQVFKVKQWTAILQPIEGHGSWDGKQAFGTLPRNSDFEGPVAVLTRATIRISRAKNFWKNVDAVGKEMATSPGFVYSLGIGEVPWLKQATFSIWRSKEEMRQFAYSQHHHKQVIQKTRTENWYSEDMFVRFKVTGIHGDLPASLVVFQTILQ